MLGQLAAAKGGRGSLGDLQVLFIDDSKDDFDLVLRELERGGYATGAACVQTAPALAAALERQSWDIAFLDWGMPSLTVSAALSILRQGAPELPCIIISGIVEEEVAVDALRAGARDFLPKHRLTRLLPSVERTLADSAERLEHAKAREQLLVSDRMATVGVLAAGTAHELHHPLVSLITNLELALRHTAELSASLGSSPALQSLREELTDAGESARCMRQILFDVRRFSQGSEGHVETVDVQSVLDASLRMVAAQLRGRAQLRTDFAPVRPVRSSEAQLGQIFLNLLLNAIQAIPEGYPDQHEVGVKTRMNSDGKVEIQIRDTGAGMPPFVLKRLFTPFFATQSGEQGSGLGSSICQRIVRALGGDIQVESTLGKGSIFRVTLDPSPDSLTLPPSSRPAAPSVRRGRVLVIDDEPLVTRAVRRTLHLEHDVVEAHRAEEALEKLASGEHFDVIICALMLPTMSGMALHATLEQKAPEQAEKMVFLTSSPDTVQARRFLREVTNYRVQKPFDIAALLAVVNDRMRPPDSMATRAPQ